jgi:hypothetical protein
VISVITLTVSHCAELQETKASWRGLKEWLVSGDTWKKLAVEIGLLAGHQIKFKAMRRHYKAGGRRHGSFRWGDIHGTGLTTPVERWGDLDIRPNTKLLARPD